MGSKKYNYQDVVKIFNDRGYELISTEDQYINVNSKLKYICPKHRDKGELTITFSKIRIGEGCPYCGREKSTISRKRSVDQNKFRKMTEGNGFEYIGYERKETSPGRTRIFIKYICPKHRRYGTQYMIASNMNRDVKGCPYCSNHIYSGNRKSYKQIMPPSQIKKIRPNIDIIDNDYKRASDKVKCKCNIHNKIFVRPVKDIIQMQICPDCQRENSSLMHFMNDEEVNKKVHVLNPQIDVVQYHGATAYDSVWHCNKHNVDFTKNYSQLVRSKSGCKFCNQERLQMLFGIPQKECTKRLYQTHPQITMIGEYRGYNEKTQFYCSVHNYKFTDTPHNIVCRKRCCDMDTEYIKQEKMCLLIESFGIKITRQKTFQDCKDKNVLPFDCYLDDYNILIQYDGEQHSMPVNFGGRSSEESNKKLEYTKRHDAIKNNFCKDKGIPLIRINYTDYSNMKQILIQKLNELNVPINV